MSLNAVEDDTVFPTPSNACPFKDWEIEKETAGVLCGNQRHRKKKRAHITDDCEADGALWSKVSWTTNKVAALKHTQTIGLKCVKLVYN